MVSLFRLLLLLLLLSMMMMMMMMFPWVPALLTTRFQTLHGHESNFTRELRRRRRRLR